VHATATDSSNPSLSPTLTPTYEMTIIRRIDPTPVGAAGGPLAATDKYYKVHMTISEEDYRYLIATQRDASKREVHQRRYYFVNGRQPVIVIKNQDPWLLSLCQPSLSLSKSCSSLAAGTGTGVGAGAGGVSTLSASRSLDDLAAEAGQEQEARATQLSSTRLTPAWVKVCTEGSRLNPLPSFLNVGETIKSNSMEYTISIAAAAAAVEADACTSGEKRAG
jgi:hypothetical protein